MFPVYPVKIVLTTAYVNAHGGLSPARPSPGLLRAASTTGACPPAGGLSPSEGLSPLGGLSPCERACLHRRGLSPPHGASPLHEGQPPPTGDSLLHTRDSPLQQEHSHSPQKKRDGDRAFTQPPPPLCGGTAPRNAPRLYTGGLLLTGGEGRA
jgi:hypothetical protein